MGCRSINGIEIQWADLVTPIFIRQFMKPPPCHLHSLYNTTTAIIFTL